MDRLFCFYKFSVKFVFVFKTISEEADSFLLFFPLLSLLLLSVFVLYICYDITLRKE